MQVVEQGGEGPIESGSSRSLRQLKLLPCVSQPPPLLHSVSSSLVALPETRHKRHARFDQPPGQQHRHGVDARPITLADLLGLARRSKADLVCREASNEKALRWWTRSRRPSVDSSARYCALSMALKERTAVE